MLNKPKFMKPSTNITEYVVDVGENNDMIFSCIVDGNESINAWRIQIYTLNDNSLVFDTNRQSCSAFFPIDEKNKNVTFTVNLKNYWTNDCYKVDSSDNILFKNDKEPYYWTISFWSTLNEDALNPSTTSCEEVFYANSSPIVKINYKESNNDYVELIEGQEVNSKKCYFKATYSQSEGIQLKRYGWRLIDTDGNNILLDTISHNQIYGSADNILCYYDGFLNGNYSIEIYVETQNNYIYHSEPILFSVSYTSRTLSGDFKIETLKDESAVMLNWSDAKVIKGHIEGNDEIDFIKHYPIVNDTQTKPSTSVEIGEDSSVVFDSDVDSDLNISEDCYTVISMQLPNQNDTTIFLAEGKAGNNQNIMRKLSFISGKFIYSIVGSSGDTVTRTYIPTYAPSLDVWYVITMSPFLGENGTGTTLTVVENIATGGLYPSNNLYPSDDLYPSFGTWKNTDLTVELFND